MAIYSDSAGNYYLGDCLYGAHNGSFPSVEYLQAYPHSGISAEIEALCTASSLRYRNVLPQYLFDQNSLLIADTIMLSFGALSDTIDDRYIFTSHGFLLGTSGGSGSHPPVAYYNNGGFTGINNYQPNNTTLRGVIGKSNNFYTVTTQVLSNFHIIPFSNTKDSLTRVNWVGDPDYTGLFWAGVCDGESLGLFTQIKRFSTGRICQAFWYAGTLKDVNPNYGHNGDIITRSICIMGHESPFPASPTYEIGAGHYMDSTRQLCLTSGRANYAIVCSDGQTPSATWLAEMVVFDAAYNVAIGTVRNLFLATGTFIIGKTYKISGSVFPDSGSIWFLALGIFAGKTVMMRCYSSAS